MTEGGTTFGLMSAIKQKIGVKEASVSERILL